MAESSTYVRDARPSEFEEVAMVIARAFYNDPLTNWMGSISHKISLPSRSSMDTSKLSKISKELELLYYFYHSLVLATHMVKGRVVGVFERGDEKPVAACLWLPPNARVDTPWVFFRSKQYRAMLGTWGRPGGWGFTGLKRSTFTYETRMDSVQKEAMKLKSVDFKSAWHLMDVATDPDEEGKGYCGLLIRHGLADITGDAPVYIEATTPHSRDIYEHLGFEITASPVFGRKEVTKDGLSPIFSKNETASGFTIWTLLKM